MTPKKGLVGKELKQNNAKNPVDKGGKPPSKPPLGGGKPVTKDLPAKGSANNLSAEEVAQRLKVHPGHVERWLKEGLLKGSQTSVQLYELEKFKARHHSDIVKAQHAAPSSPAKTTGKAPATSPKQAKPAKLEKANKSSTEPAGPSSFKRLADAVRGAFKGILFTDRKPDKTSPPPVLATTEDESTVFVPFPAAATPRPLPEEMAATATLIAPIPRPTPRDEFVAPPPPSTEVWPSLESSPATNLTAPPDWLTQSSEPGHLETMVLRSDLVAQVRAASASPPPGQEPVQDDRARNQQLLEQLQEQRRVELELQDEIETLRQRLDLSLAGERETRSQLKRSRQELQSALEDLEQRPPAGQLGQQDISSQRELEWQAHADQLEQRNLLLEQQLEKLRSHAEDIRQQGLQWHQVATQQDQQLRQLRQQHSSLESEAGTALEELERSLRESQQQLSHFESAHREQAAQIQSLQGQLASQESPSADWELESRAKDRAIQQLRFTTDQLQSQLLHMENQQRNQVTRWEQELQASASWVQKLTEAVSQRDRRIQELESQLSSRPAVGPSAVEEELKSQIMSLRVELNSLRRNFEIITIQSRSLEKQLQESQRAMPKSTSERPVLSLDLPASQADQSTAEDEGGFRRRLDARLRSLGSPPPLPDPPRKGLQPPPFLELDIPES